MGICSDKDEFKGSENKEKIENSDEKVKENTYTKENLNFSYPCTP